MLCNKIIITITIDFILIQIWIFIPGICN